MTYILILFAFGVPVVRGQTAALTTQEFRSEASCDIAGKAATALATTLVKINYVCVPK